MNGVPRRAHHRIRDCVPRKVHHRIRADVQQEVHRRTSWRATLKTNRRHSDLLQLFHSLRVPHQSKARTRLRRSPQSESSNSPNSSECLVRSEFAHLVDEPFNPRAPRLSSHRLHCQLTARPLLLQSANIQARKSAMCLRITQFGRYSNPREIGVNRRTPDFLALCLGILSAPRPPSGGETGSFHRPPGKNLQLGWAVSGIFDGRKRR